MNKKLISAKIPKSYENKLTSLAIRRNIIRAINFLFDGQTSSFCEFLKCLTNLKLDTLKNHKYFDAIQNLSKLDYLSNKISGRSNATFTPADAQSLELILGINEHSLFAQPEEKETIFLFLKVIPKKITIVFAKLKDIASNDFNYLVDEVSVLTGQYDIFLRLYGSRNQVTDFYQKMWSISDITHCETTVSFNESFSFKRYPVASHPNRKPAPPSFITKKWIEDLPEVAAEFLKEELREAQQQK